MATLGAAALWAARRSSGLAFWWAFWGGMAGRLALLAVLMFFCLRSPSLSAPALLLSYVGGLFILVPVEFALVLKR